MGRNLTPDRDATQRNCEHNCTFEVLIAQLFSKQESTRSQVWKPAYRFGRFDMVVRGCGRSLIYHLVRSTSLNRKSDPTMSILTEEEFSKHVGTEFYVNLGEREVDLTLAEVKGYMPDPSQQRSMERFSLFFDGPADWFLPQQNFHMRHDRMGEFDIFLVPISGNEKGFRYEAVFNYFK